MAYNIIRYDCKQCGKEVTKYYYEDELHLRIEDLKKIDSDEGLLCWDCDHPAPTPVTERSAYDEYLNHIKNLTPAEFAAADQPVEENLPGDSTAMTFAVDPGIPDSDMHGVTAWINNQIVAALAVPAVHFEQVESSVRSSIHAAYEELERLTFVRFSGIGMSLYQDFQRRESERLFERRKEEMILDYIATMKRQVKKPSRKVFHNIERRVRREVARMKIDRPFLDFYGATRHMLTVSLWP